MSHKLSRRLASLVVIAVFALSSIPAAAGAHYDVSFEHRSGDKKHAHHSRFHLSEFSDYHSEALTDDQKDTETHIIRNADRHRGYYTDHSKHTHVAEYGFSKQQDKPFIHTGKQEFDVLAKLSAIAFSTVAYQSLNHHRLSVRGPPASLI